MTLPLDIYIRVSRLGDRDLGDLYTVEEQEQTCRDHAAAHRIALAENPIVEINKSGRTTKRPGLQLALERVRQGQSGGIIVARLSRLSRRVGDVDRLLNGAEREDGNRADGLLDLGARFVAVADRLDLTLKKMDSRDKLFLGMLSVFAQFELDNMTEQWESLHRRNVEQRGLHHSGIPPVGYRYDGEGAERRLVVDDEVAPHIEEIFRMRANGHSLPEVANYLEAKRVVNRRARREGPEGEQRWVADVSWSKEAVRKILKNEVYVGVARGPYDTKREGAHAAVVDRAMFDRANLPSGTRGWNGGERAGEDRGLLKGLVRCAACGTACSPSSGLYRCNNFRCDSQGRIKIEKLDAHVVHRLLDAPDEALQWDTTEATERWEEANTAYESAQAAVHRVAKLAAVMDDADFKVAYDEAKAVRDDAYARLIETPQPRLSIDALNMRAEGRDPDAGPDDASFFFDDVFALPEQRTHIRSFVDKVTIAKGGRWEPLAPRVQIYLGTGYVI